jgi:HAE1 family hydrophobic/amphiphilic exporter-1
VRFVNVTFNLDRNIEAAAQDVLDRVQSVCDCCLQVQTRPCTETDSDSEPVMTIAVSGDRSIRELTEFADKVVRVQIERSVGIGEVGISTADSVAPSASGSTPTGWRPTDPDHRVRQALVRQNSDVFRVAM